tara:strand:- start:261 stop:671 length:411 start_codon:yes stop_codon:yes gene_type:complete
MSENASTETEDVIDRIGGPELPNEPSATPAASASPPSETPPAVATDPGDAAPVVTVIRATGKRKVRGVVKTVNLPHYRVMIGKQLAAVTSLKKNKSVCAVAEILDTEEAPIIKAVSDKRGDDLPIQINRPPVVTAE